MDQKLFQTPFQIDKIDYDWLKRKNINRIKKYSRPNKLSTHSLCSVFHDCCYSRNMKNEIMSILSGQEELSIHNTLCITQFLPYFCVWKMCWPIFFFSCWKYIIPSVIIQNHLNNREQHNLNWIYRTHTIFYRFISLLSNKAVNF